MPTVFKQASDDMGRLIFHAGARAIYVFDLQLIDGRIQIWSKNDTKIGRAIGMQKLPFVIDIDFIDHNFVSVLTTEKDCSWKHGLQLKQLVK
jgi:hypothetical protein